MGVPGFSEIVFPFGTISGLSNQKQICFGKSKTNLLLFFSSLLESNIYIYLRG
jgi:hypothetical protein